MRAERGDPRLALLFAWVIAAGGWISGMTAELPPLPACLARLELRRMLRQHGITVAEGDPTAMNAASDNRADKRRMTNDVP